MEKRLHHNDELAGRNDLGVSFDVSTGCVHAFGQGFWAVKQAHAYFADWRNLVTKIHNAGRSVKALVDLTESGVQKAEVAAIVASITVGLYQKGDLIAMLVPNCLTKMQMRRVLDAQYHEFFLSQNAALTWLEARSGDSVSPVMGQEVVPAGLRVLSN